MESQLTLIIHPTDDILETYAFNRLSEADTCLAEEHLLICSTCQKTLRDLDNYILLMKAATAAYIESRPRDPVGRKDRLWERVLAWPTGMPRVPTAVLALVLSGVSVAVVTSWRLEPSRVNTTTPVAVSLIAFRGEGIVTVVPPGTRLDLAIDMTGLRAAGSYRLEAVNATGQPIWEAPAVAADGKLVAQVEKGLKPGIYWVRLYSDGELVREFGLKVSG